MSSIKRDLIKRYYDSRSACQVLGILMAKPKLLLSIDYNLDKEDFVGAIHKTLFACIYNLAHKGINSINLTDIENYLHQHVFLELFVKVQADWRNDDKLLKTYGYKKEKE